MSTQNCLFLCYKIRKNFKNANSNLTIYKDQTKRYNTTGYTVYRTTYIVKRRLMYIKTSKKLKFLKFLKYITKHTNALFDLTDYAHFGTLRLLIQNVLSTLKMVLQA